MKEITAEEFKNIKGYALIDFNATWCGPCRMLKPILEKLDAEYENVTFAGIDVDNEPDLAGALGINSIPCVIMFKDGAEISRSVGFYPEKMIKNFIDTCLK